MPEIFNFSSNFLKGFSAVMKYAESLRRDHEFESHMDHNSTAQLYPLERKLNLGFRKDSARVHCSLRLMQAITICVIYSLLSNVDMCGDETSVSFSSKSNFTINNVGIEDYCYKSNGLMRINSL